MKYIVILFLSSCFIYAQNVAEHFKTKQFEVAIFPESSDEIMQGKRFTPTKEEIIKAENALKSKLKEVNRNFENQYNSHIIHKNLKKYIKIIFTILKRQNFLLSSLKFLHFLVIIYCGDNLLIYIFF